MFNFLSLLLCYHLPFFHLCPWHPTSHLLSAKSFQRLLTCSSLCAPGPALARGKSVGCSHGKKEGCQVQLRLEDAGSITPSQGYSIAQASGTASELLPASLAKLITGAVTPPARPHCPPVPSWSPGYLVLFLSSQHYDGFLCIPEWQTLVLQDLQICKAFSRE